MPELRPHHDPAGVMATPPSPRAALFWDGTYWRVALVDAAGHLQLDVVTSGLPAGAATAAGQALALTQLQLIQDLYYCLQSVATNRLIVRGEDQLFSFYDTLHVRSSGAPSAADGWRECGPVLAGGIWVVTTIAARDNTTPLTEIRMERAHAGVHCNLSHEIRAIAAGENCNWSGITVLEEDDTLRCYFTGALVGDTVYVEITGYQMTKET